MRKPSPKADWQQELIDAVTTLPELCRLLELDLNDLDLSEEAIAQFALKVPRGFVARMQKGSWSDPLLKQILPVSSEMIPSPDFNLDPLGEAQANPLSGLLHKYRGRVLLTLTGTCAINCRYCFRRHFPYADNTPSQDHWQEAFRYISADASIREVILSGGDPLMLNEKGLSTFSESLNAIPHVKILRIHSRMPVVLPERVTTEFIAWIQSLKQTPVMVIHCNHPQELNLQVRTRLLALKAAGVTVLNQAVLLKGVNDEVEILKDLSENLFAAGVQPYYLHLLDKVQGAAHFEVESARARQLYKALTHVLPGYLVPKLAQEQAKGQAKVLLGTDL